LILLNLYLNLIVRVKYILDRKLLVIIAEESCETWDFMNFNFLLAIDKEWHTTLFYLLEVIKLLVEIVWHIETIAKAWELLNLEIRWILIDEARNITTEQ